MVLGTPGGGRIFATVAQVLSRVIDHHLSLRDAINVPRIWNTSSIDTIQYENPMVGYGQYTVTEGIIDALMAMGHGDLTIAASGSVQAIQFMEDGTLYGIADPRQDGKAVGYSK